jgi:cephalosporin hydroxylase
VNLWQDFSTSQQGKVVNKWEQYFPVYERHLSQWRNKSLTFIEVGVSQGGSLQMWRRFFGPMATIIGIDISPSAKKHEEHGINVRIGDQSDPVFLASLVDEFGPPDVVLDDGSHQMEHVKSTFEFFYPKLSKNGIYVVEDANTSYDPEYGGGLDEPSSFINLSKDLIDRLHAMHTKGEIEQDFFSRNTFGLSFYDSMVVFERGAFPSKLPLMMGKRDFSYKMAMFLPKKAHPIAKRIKRMIF